MKYNPHGSIKRYKKHFVAQSLLQVHRIDYTKIFVPIIKRESLRIYLVIATILGIIVLEMDVINAYLESPFG